MEFLKIAFAVAIAVAGWIVAHRYTSKRDTNNSRRATRVDALSTCYKALTRSGIDGVMVIADESGKAINRAGPVEDAIALIHLYGSQEQSDLASDYARQVADTKHGDSTRLVNCLRCDIRRMLGESDLNGVPSYLKISVGKPE